MTKTKPQYIGNKEIVATNHHAPGLRPDMLEVQYSDGTRENLHKDIFDATVSADPYDASQLRERRVQVVAASVLATMKKYNLRLGELDYFTQVLQGSFENSMRRASAVFWRKPTDERTLDQKVMDDVLDARTVQDLDDVLKAPIE